MTGYSYPDVVERLFREFEDRYSLTVIVDAVHECRAQLSCVPGSAMPEMLERLARQRLNSTPQPRTSAAVDEVITLARHEPDLVWVRPGSEAQGWTLVEAKSAVGC